MHVGQSHHGTYVARYQHQPPPQSVSPFQPRNRASPSFFLIFVQPIMQACVNGNAAIGKSLGGSLPLCFGAAARQAWGSIDDSRKGKKIMPVWADDHASHPEGPRPARGIGETEGGEGNKNVIERTRQQQHEERPTYSLVYNPRASFVHHHTTPRIRPEKKREEKCRGNKDTERPKISFFFFNESANKKAGHW